MRRAMGRTGLAITMAFLAASAAWAADSGFGRSLEAAIVSGDIVQQRKDVDETARPLPPSGPANRFCSPGQPICP